jgi:glycine/D-amino acid oxidase-like deaminating enzyme
MCKHHLVHGFGFAHLQVPGCENLVLAAGHAGSGLTLALATAEIVADLLAGAELDDLPSYAEPLGLCSTLGV